MTICCVALFCQFTHTHTHTHTSRMGRCEREIFRCYTLFFLFFFSAVHAHDWGLVVVALGGMYVGTYQGTNQPGRVSSSYNWGVVFNCKGWRDDGFVVCRLMGLAWVGLGLELGRSGRASRFGMGWDGMVYFTPPSIKLAPTAKSTESSINSYVRATSLLVSYSTVAPSCRYPYLRRLSSSSRPIIVVPGTLGRRYRTPRSNYRNRIDPLPVTRSVRRILAT
jgi:hypothetical protein